MRTLKLLKMGMVGLVGVFASLLLPSVSQATVSPGYDLLYTEYANYNGIEFKGLEFGTFDFGSGSVWVGNADTILQRTVAVTPTGTISSPDFQIIALSLISVDQIDTSSLGGSGLAYVCTQGVQDTGSSITIMDNNKFTSSLSFTFNLYKCDAQGNLSGFLRSDSLSLTQAATDWSSTPPSHAVLIPGINYLLPGGQGDGTHDFFTGRAEHMSQFIHHITVTATPEPASLLLLGTGIGLLAYRRRKAA